MGDAGVERRIVKIWLLIVGTVIGLLMGYRAFFPNAFTTPVEEADSAVATSPKPADAIDNLSSQGGNDNSDPSIVSGNVANDLSDSKAATLKNPADGYDIEAALAEADMILSSVSVTASQDARLAALQEEILITASVSNDILERLINLVNSDPSTDIAKFATTILSRLKHPETHQLGLDLVSTANRDAVIAGLDLLSGTTDMNNEQSLTAAQSAIETFPGDGAVVLPAIDVLSSSSSPDVNQQSTLQSLGLLASSTNDAIRSASIFAISNLATNADDMLPVIQALDSDSTEERVSAAMAIQQSRTVSNTLRDALVRKMIDTDELWEIRRIAADSLDQYTLTGDQTVQLQQFREEQVRVSQGG